MRGAILRSRKSLAIDTKCHFENKPSETFTTLACARRAEFRDASATDLRDIAINHAIKLPAITGEKVPAASAPRA